MPHQLPFTGYSLKGRLLVWVLAIYVACLSVVLLLIPILDWKLESFNEASTYYIERAKEAEGTNYARLIVLELAGQKDLLQVKAGPASATDQSIIGLIWEKVTFNLAIDGIELIQGQKNDAGQRVTFLFYRQPPGEKPMSGPQKVVKEFSGLEAELIEGINRHQRVDQKILGTINHGPKKEGNVQPNQPSGEELALHGGLHLVARRRPYEGPAASDRRQPLQVTRMIGRKPHKVNDQ